MTVHFPKFDLVPVWGFQTKTRLAVALDQNELSYGVRKTLCMGPRVENTERVITYVPGLNILSGAIRIIHVLNHKKIAPELRDRHIVRGVLDIAFGPLLIIADVIVTIWNQRIAKQYIEAFKTENEGRIPRICTFSNHHVTSEPNSTDGQPRYYYTVYPDVEIKSPTEEQKIKARYIYDSGKNYPVDADKFFEIVAGIKDAK